MIALLAVLAVARPDRPAETIAPPAEREPLPALSVLDGRNPADHLDPQSFAGKVVVINVWYEW